MMRIGKFLRIALALALTGGMGDDVAQAEATVGLTVDAGVPDGTNVAVVLRPIRPLRLHAGLGYNGIARGYRVGATLVPFASWCSPTLSLDVGRYTDGDANPLLRMASGDQTLDTAVLDRVGYRYANAHVGLEFGRKRATFYIHGGVSRVTGRVHEVLASTDMSASTLSVTFTEDPTVTITAVSARVGLIVYFN
ncbi:MAG: hypothetical protein NT062_27765 [Proteobacteria bacterium]|nr:hypothetical protein [Pseudomonadota bacterium]